MRLVVPARSGDAQKAHLFSTAFIGDFASSDVFPVHIIFYLKDPQSRSLIEKDLRTLTVPERPFPQVPEIVNFTTEFAADEADLGVKLMELLLNRHHYHPVVISDSFVTEDSRGAVRESPLAHLVHEAFHAHARLYSLVAISERPVGKVNGITFTMAKTQLENSVHLKRLISKSVARLSLLAPPKKKLLESLGSVGITVGVAKNETDIRDSFALRHYVYSSVGYLDEVTERNTLKLETDFYDSMAIHLIARRTDTNELIGTHRLIVPLRPKGMIRSVLGPIDEIMEAQRGWVQSVSKSFIETEIRRRLQHPSAAPVPALNNAEIRPEWKHVLKEAFSGAEISRLITHPAYKGLGVARVLLRLGIAGALDMGKKTVFGEAIPAHLAMYRDFGFDTLESHENRFDSAGGMATSAQKIIGNLIDTGKSKMARSAWGDLSLLKIASTNITTSDFFQMDVRIGDLILDSSEQLRRSES